MNLHHTETSQQTYSTHTGITPTPTEQGYGGSPTENGNVQQGNASWSCVKRTGGATTKLPRRHAPLRSAATRSGASGAGRNNTISFSHTMLPPYTVSNSRLSHSTEISRLPHTQVPILSTQRSHVTTRPPPRTHRPMLGHQLGHLLSQSPFSGCGAQTGEESPVPLRSTTCSPTPLTPMAEHQPAGGNTPSGPNPLFFAP